MNNILSKGVKHRKATSDCIANSQIAHSSAIMNSKVLSYFNQCKYVHPSIEKNETTAQFRTNKNQNTKTKSYNFIANYKKPNVKKSNQYHRSNSFDKYFLYNIKKNNDKCQSNYNNEPSLQNTTNANINTNTNRNENGYSSKLNYNTFSFLQSQKILKLNSPFIKKNIEINIKQPGEKEKEKKKNSNSFSIEEYLQKSITLYGKMHSITRKNHNGYFKPEKDYSQQTRKRKQEKLVYNTKLTQRFLMAKCISPLLTMPSQLNSNINNNIKLKEDSAQIKLPLSSRRIEENIQDDSIEENDVNVEAREMMIGDNFNTKEIDENVEKKRLIRIPFQAKSIFEIESEKELINQSTKSNLTESEIKSLHSSIMALTMPLPLPTKETMSLNKNDASHISIKYQDIIQNNINYSKINYTNNIKPSSLNTTSTSKRITDLEVNKTPQLNKFIQFYPQAVKSINEQSNSNTDNLFKESDLAHNEPNSIIPKIKDSIKRVIYSTKKTIPLPSKLKHNHHRHHKQDLSDSAKAENENMMVDIDTDECLFEGEENNEREGKKNIPVFSIKLFNYNHNHNYSSKSKHLPIERTFKNRFISSLILSFLDYKALSKLCMCNHYLRSKLKKVQYESIIKIILNNDETKQRIKESAWIHSKLFNDSFLSRTYYNYAYRKCKYDEDIQKDLTRTFPDDDSFKYRNKNYNKLYHLLTAYANYNKSIGYAQGLNFLAAHSIFAFDKPEEVFIFIDGFIIKFELEQLFGVNNHLKEKMEEIGKLLKKCAPYVMNYLDRISLGHEFFTANWLLTLFSNSMRRKCLFFIWDFMIVFGKQFFNYFIVAIMIKYSTKIVTCDQSQLSHLMKGLLKSDVFESDFELVITKTFDLMRIYCI